MFFFETHSLSQGTDSYSRLLQQAMYASFGQERCSCMRLQQLNSGHKTSTCTTSSILWGSGEERTQGKALLTRMARKGIPGRQAPPAATRATASSLRWWKLTASVLSAQVTESDTLLATSTSPPPSFCNDLCIMVCSTMMQGTVPIAPPSFH